MRNVDSFNIKYFSSPASTTEVGSSNALGATTIEVTLNGKKVTAGRDITNTGSIRATKLNNIDVDLPVPGVPNVDAQANGNSVIFDWNSVPLASSYVISYNINGGAWVNTTTNAQTTTYTVNANRTDTVTVRVSAKNATGESAYDTASATIPAWYHCGLQNGWENYASTSAAANYTKTSSHVVTLKGLIKSGTVTNGTVLCTLPAEYRPSQRIIFQTASAGVATRIDVTSNGDVLLMGSGNATWLTLNGISFVASTAPYTWTLYGDPLLNSWVNYNTTGTWLPMQSTLDGSGRVHVEGLIKNGTYTMFTPIITLPAAHRPSLYTLVPTRGSTGFNYMGVDTDQVETRGIDPGGFYSIQAIYYPSTSSGWTNLSLQNGWINYGSATHSTAQYIKAADGLVTVKGLIKNGTTTNGTVIATLPAGYRPKERAIVHCVANGAYGRIDIQANGDIVANGVSATWTSIELRFMAEQ